MTWFSLSYTSRTSFLSLCNFTRLRRRPTKCMSTYMGHDELNSECKRRANFRMCNVSSYMTELLEIHAEVPKLHVLFIPGNPGVVSFYKDFLESLYELLKGNVSITAIGHISHTKMNWEHGRLFSLEEQIEHKIDFIKHELQNVGVPILLVGHSIGSYISIKMFQRYPEKVIYCIGMYPFLALNNKSLAQSTIGKLAASPILCVALSSVAGILGLLPSWVSRFSVKKSIGQSWSATAVEAAHTHLLQYHCVRNILFMAKTEFEKLSETPDWEFMRVKQAKIAYLFGTDDHWGPLSMYEEISKQVPDVTLSIEREGHTHAYSCSEAGSLWVAQHVASLINKNVLNSIL